MFGIGMSEMIIICAVALLVFGPEELPQIVKKIARGLGEVRKASDDLRRSIDLDDDEEDRRSRAFARARLAEEASSSAASAASANGAASGNATEPATTNGVAEAAEVPPVIPGSALTPAHGDDDAPRVVAVAAVARGSHGEVDDQDGGAAPDVVPAGDHGEVVVDAAVTGTPAKATGR
jgi:sec-independent protein translocase protein TatB